MEFIQYLFQSVPAEDGNTKLPKATSPALHWCFTYNNYTKQDIPTLTKGLQDICSKYVFQEETGEKGTPHLQGYFELKKKDRLTALKKILGNGLHFEKCRNIADSILYCQKDSTRTGEVFKWGFPPTPKPVKILSELRPWQQQCLALLKSECDRSIFWIYDTDGNVGKTAFCKYLYMTNNIMYITGGKGSDILHLATECLKAKPDCETFIFDLPRSVEGCISYNALEQIKNGFWTSTKYEGGTVCINSPNVIIFANWAPDKTMLSADRWNIYKIHNMELERE